MALGFRQKIRCQICYKTLDRQGRAASPKQPRWSRRDRPTDGVFGLIYLGESLRWDAAVSIRHHLQKNDDENQQHENTESDLPDRKPADLPKCRVRRFFVCNDGLFRVERFRFVPNIMTVTATARKARDKRLLTGRTNYDKRQTLAVVITFGLVIVFGVFTVFTATPLAVMIVPAMIAGQFGLRAAVQFVRHFAWFVARTGTFVQWHRRIAFAVQN